MKKYKKIVFYGDSITKGTYTEEGAQIPMCIASPAYPEIVSKELEAENFINYGTNGISYSKASRIMTEASFYNTVEKCELGDAIFVALGTNDYGTDVPLGDAGEEDGMTFFGAADFCLGKLKARSPESDVFVLLPLPRSDQNKPNRAGFVLDDYRNALVSIAKKYGEIVIDGGKLPVDPANAADKRKYIFDGTHINEAGHRLLARFILDEIG